MKKHSLFLGSRRLGILSSVCLFAGLTAFAPIASANVIDLAAVKKFFGIGKEKQIVTETVAPAAPAPVVNPAPAAKTPAPVAKAPASATKTPAPVAKAPAPTPAKTSTPPAKSAAPATKTPASIAKATAPAAKTPATAAKPSAGGAKVTPPQKKPEVMKPAPKPAVDAKPAKVVSGLPAGATTADFAYRGYLVSSIYYNAVIRDEGNDCGKEAMSSIRNDDGVELMRVCAKTVKTCLMEGVCQILRKKESRIFNYHGTVKGRPAFFELKNGDCVYGFGVSAGGCLDPFYTLAADLKHHKAGEVVYIPQVVGTILPGGQKHNGFFIIRDMGGRIKGANRFDFFTGPIGWKAGINPFFQIKLSDSKNKFTYYRVTGATAERIKDQRNFPKLPDDPMFQSFQDLE